MEDSDIEINQYKEVIENLSKNIEHVKKLNIKYNKTIDTTPIQSIINDFNKYINNFTS